MICQPISRSVQPGGNGNRATAPMIRPLSRISIAQWPSGRPASSCSVIHRASSCRISSRSATRGIAGVSQRATSRLPNIASAASASSSVHGRNRRRLVISLSAPATWTWASSHIDYSFSPSRSLGIDTGLNKGTRWSACSVWLTSGVQTVRPRHWHRRLVEDLFEPVNGLRVFSNGKFGFVGE